VKRTFNIDNRRGFHLSPPLYFIKITFKPNHLSPDDPEHLLFIGKGNLNDVNPGF
jgi:hypothetical protein